MRTKQKNRIRKSTKYIGTIISIVLLVTSFLSLMKNISNENIKTRTTTTKATVMGRRLL